ncbi:hypothetical protein TMEC54S_03463 [Thauera mechernichensis]
MAGVSSLGVGSGLDLAGILKGLMQVEQQPLINLQRKEISYQARISALGSLKGALSALQTSASNLLPPTGKNAAEKFTSFSASVASTDIASASASTGAAPGVYSLEVSQLAQSQRLVSATPGAPPASPYANADSSIAAGTLTIDFGKFDGGVYTAEASRKLEVVIDGSNNTLGGLRDAINAANGGVTATIITGTAGAQLVLTAKSAGSENVMRLSGLSGFEFDPVAGSTSMSQDPALGGRAAQNALFSLNGIAASSSANTVTGVLEGVTLTLKKTNTGAPTDITVSKDTTSSLTAGINAFVKSFNEANTAIRSLGAYNAETKESGALQGQAIIRTTQAQLRSLVFGATNGGNPAYQRLSDLGVSFNKDGGSRGRLIKAQQGNRKRLRRGPPSRHKRGRIIQDLTRASRRHDWNNHGPYRQHHPHDQGSLLTADSAHRTPDKYRRPLPKTIHRTGYDDRRHEGNQHLSDPTVGCTSWLWEQ